MNRLIGFVLIPIFGLAALIFGSASLPHAWDAAHGRGQRGVLLVTSKHCSPSALGSHCTGLYGTFEEGEGIVIHNAYLDGIPHGAKIGSAIPVRYEGENDPPIVYRASRSREWILIVVLMSAGLVALIFWGKWMSVARRGESTPWTPKPYSKPKTPHDRRSPDKTGHAKRRGK